MPNNNLESIPNRSLELASRLGKQLSRLHYKVTTAESCTGGGVASIMTEIAGSSAWFEYGFVTYANAAKTGLLGVEADILARCGAVSQEVVEQMAQGALRVSGADLAVSISGIAGPDGGTEAKPVGTVWVAWAAEGQLLSRKFCFDGNRAEIRAQAVCAALEGLSSLAESIRSTV